MENVCRLCLQKEENMLNVVSLENEKLCSIIFDCFSIKITNNDALPKLLCTICFGKLKSFNEFREKCKILDCILRAHYKMDFNYDDTLSKIKIYQNAQVQTDITSETLQMDYGSVFIKTEEITDENDFNTHYNNDDDRHIQDNNEFHNLRHSDDVVSNSADSQNTLKTSNKLKLKKKLKRSGISGSRKSDRLKNKDKILKCHFCLQEFLYIEEFLKHCRFHIIKESKKRGCKKRNANKENFTCQVCNDVLFVSHSELIRHLKIHTGEIKYPCKICKKTFTKESYLSQHFFTHTINKAFRCHVCGSKYKHYSSLYNHTKKCKMEHTPKSIKKITSS